MKNLIGLICLILFAVSSYAQEYTADPFSPLFNYGGGGGSGDIEQVGQCTSGACFPSVTFPTSGTVTTRDAAETLENKTLDSPTILNSLNMPSGYFLLGASSRLAGVESIEAISTGATYFGNVSFSNTLTDGAIFFGACGGGTEASRSIAPANSLCTEYGSWYYNGSGPAMGSGWRGHIRGTPDASNVSMSFTMLTRDGTTLTERWELVPAGDLTPMSDSTYDIGTASLAVADIFTDEVTYTPITTLGTCTSANTGDTKYVKATNTAGSMYFCNNNQGYYEWTPMHPGNTADFWLALDMSEIDAFGGTLNRGGNLTGRDGEADHPGILEIATGTTINSNSYVFMHSGSSSRGTFTATAPWTCEVIFKLDQTTDTLLTAGMQSEADTPNGNNVAFIEYDSATDTNWQAITRDGTGEAGQTETDTGVTVTTGWIRMLVRRDASDVRFYMKAGTGDYALVATHTTDLPADFQSCHVNIQNLAAANKSAKIDYMRQSRLQIAR